MSAVETVKDFMIALEAKEFDKAASYLSDDFIFSGWTPQPLDKAEFMTDMTELKAGLPNLSYHFQAVKDVHDLDQVAASRVCSSSWALMCPLSNSNRCISGRRFTSVIILAPAPIYTFVGQHAPGRLRQNPFKQSTR